MKVLLAPPGRNICIYIPHLCICNLLGFVYPWREVSLPACHILDYNWNSCTICYRTYTIQEVQKSIFITPEINRFYLGPKLPPRLKHGTSRETFENEISVRIWEREDLAIANILRHMDSTETEIEVVVTDWVECYPVSYTHLTLPTILRV